MSLHRLKDCELTVTHQNWSFAARNELEIAEHWKRHVQLNPKMFDGDVFILEKWSLDDGVLRGNSVRTKFSAYVYWREFGTDDNAGDEAFATTVIVARDGGVLVAKSAAGTLNDGKYLSPGGLLDPRDLDSSGRLDLAGAAARELREETGLDASEMRRDNGFLLARVGAYVGVASVLRSHLDGAGLCERVNAFLANEDEPELEDAQVVYDFDELCRLPITDFTRLLSKAILA